MVVVHVVGMGGSMGGGWRCVMCSGNGGGNGGGGL